MTDKPTAWWHNVKDTHWLLLSRNGTLGECSECNGNPTGDSWAWATCEVPAVCGTAKSGEEARAAVSR